MKEEAASIVLRDCHLRGHMSVELRQDGRTTIFYCRLCGTRCYSDAALNDHLKGSVHARHLAEEKASLVHRPVLSLRDSDNHATVLGSTRKDTGGSGTVVSGGLAIGGRSSDADAVTKKFVTSVTVPLEWVGCAELFFQTISGVGKPVGAAWFCWQGKKQPMDTGCSSEYIQQLDYAMVVFPYSDGIGRAGFWEPVFGKDESGNCVPAGIKMQSDCKDEAPSVCTDVEMAVDVSIREKKSYVRNSRAREADCSKLGGQGPVQAKKVSQTQVRRDSKRRLGASERVCFICCQKMVPGKNIAALLNIKSGIMLCGSRNRQGVFHVFHSHCLVDWIALCEAKGWMTCLKRKKKKAQKSKKKKSVADPSSQQLASGVRDVNSEIFSLFCPECQGTGQFAVKSELEQPRYRLSQLFEWALEVVQARKAWISHQKGAASATGLLFRPDGLPEGAAQSRGLLQCYTTKGTEFLLADDADRIWTQLCDPDYMVGHRSSSAVK